MRKLTFCFAVLSTVILLSAATQARAMFLGDFCWLTFDGVEMGRIKLGLTSVGSTHLSANGIEIDETGAASPGGAVIHGTGEIVGSQLILGLNVAYTDPEFMGGGPVYARLSLSDFSGSFEAIDSAVDKATGLVSSEYDFGNLQRIACP